MKRKTQIQLMSIVLILMLVGPAFTGMAGKSNRWFGLKVGTDINTNEITDAVFSDMKNNYRVGVFAQLGKKIFLQPELYFARYTPEIGEGISAIVAPVMLGIEVFDLKVIALNIKGGAEFGKELTDGSKINYLWQGGLGVNVLGFLTADVRYTFSKGVNVFDQFSDLINNGGMVNVTVGFRFR